MPQSQNRKLARGPASDAPVRRENGPEREGHAGAWDAGGEASGGQAIVREKACQEETKMAMAKAMAMCDMAD